MTRLLVAAALLGLLCLPAAAQPYTPAEQEVLYRRQVEPLLRIVSVIALAQRCDAARPALPVQYDVAISRVGEAISDALLLIGADNNRGVRAYEEARAVLEIKQLLQAFGH